MGFFEILLIVVVALLVVGPQRMPEAVRSAALTFGKIQRSLSSTRAEIEKQIGMEEIRRQIHNEDVIDNLNKIKSGLSGVDKLIDSGEVAMPYDQEAYEKLHNQYDGRDGGNDQLHKEKPTAIAVETDSHSTEEKKIAREVEDLADKRPVKSSVVSINETLPTSAAL